MDAKRGILLIALGMGSMFALEAADRDSAEDAMPNTPVMKAAQQQTPLEGVHATTSTADATLVLAKTPNG